MAKIVKNLYNQNLGFKLDNSTFQRVVATVQEHMSNTIYVAFAIEVGGFGTLYIERTSPVLAYPGLHPYHTNNLVRVEDEEEWNEVARLLLERQILDPRWLPMDVAQNYRD